MSIQAALVRSIFCSLLVLAASYASSVAADTPAKQEVDPKAKKVLDAWSMYSTALRGFQFSSDEALDFERDGQKQSQKIILKLSAERPNKLAYTTEVPPQGDVTFVTVDTVDEGQSVTFPPPQGGATIVSDGSELSVYIKEYQKYGTEKAPDTWNAMLQNPIVQGPMNFGNAAVVRVAMLNDNPAKRLLEKTQSVKYGGLVALEGAMCHLIEARGAELGWRLWIDSSDKPLVRQFVLDLTKFFARLGKRDNEKSPFENMKVTSTVRFKDWETDPKFPAVAFTFNAPEGAEKVNSLMEIFTGGRGTTVPLAR